MSGFGGFSKDNPFFKKYARLPQANPEETAHCAACGQRLLQRTKTCPKCGSAIDDETFERIPRMRDYAFAALAVIAVWAVVLFGVFQIINKAG